MTLPYAEPLTVREPAPLTVPEPPRRGETGGEPCFPCRPGTAESAIWSDEHWTLHDPGQSALVGAVWLASRVHHDSFADMPAAAAATFAPVCGRVERAILALGDVGRVHVSRWGDGGAHFHVWFFPRPLGRLDMAGHLLPVWEDVMEPAAKDDLRAAGEKIAAAMAG